MALLKPDAPTYPQFVLWNGKVIEVMNIDFLPGALEQRKCACRSEIFYQVRIITAQGIRCHKAMCAECRVLVEVV
jgi:hypothetical protein